MVVLEWNSKYSVGMEEIDEQHKKLFDLINDVRNSIKSGQSKESIASCIRELDYYACYHFELEEKYMEKNNFPNLDEHKLQHKEFIRGIKNFKDNLDPEKVISAYNILEFLINWISFHILESDKEYAYYINNNK